MIRRLAAITVASALGIGLFMPPAGARTQALVTLVPRQTVERTYSAFTGENLPAKTREITPNPTQCGDPVAWCDTIPFSITGVSSGSTVTVVMTSTGPSGNDVDIYLYDDASGGSYSLITSDTGSSNPSRLSFTVQLPTYNLVVVNGLGTNQGYSVRWTLDPKPNTDDAASFEGEPIELNSSSDARKATPAGKTAPASTTTAADSHDSSTTEPAAASAAQPKADDPRDVQRAVAVDRVPAKHARSDLALALLVLPALVLVAVLVQTRNRATEPADPER